MPRKTKHRIPRDDAADVFTVPDFCRRHRISVSTYYNLKRAGEAPREMSVANRILITKESAAAWRREREVAGDARRKARWDVEQRAEA